MLKTLITVSTVLLTTAAFAQSNTKSPGSSEYAPGQKMQNSRVRRQGRVGIRAGTPEEHGEGPRPFGKRAGSADDDRIGHGQEEVLVG